MGKKTVIAVSVIAVFTLSTVITLTYAQSIPKPPVPEFTVKFVDGSYRYYVPPVTTASIDPYTGNKTESTFPGYTESVFSQTIVVTIKNQPFTSFTDSNGNQVSLYYNVSSKGHYASDWNYYPASQEGIIPSNSGYTVLTFGIGASNPYDQSLGNVPVGGEVDFQVEALVGSYNKTFVELYGGHPLLPSLPIYTFNGETSGWSNTQTITIPQPSPSEKPTSTPTLTPTAIPALVPSESPTPTPIVAPTPIQVIVQSVATWFYTIIIGFVLVVVVLLSVIALLLRKKRG